MVSGKEGSAHLGRLEQGVRSLLGRRRNVSRLRSGRAELGEPGPLPNPPRSVSSGVEERSSHAMSLSPAFLDELRARTTLSALIGSREAQQGRARVEGLLPVPQREDAELLRQRRQGLLPLLRLRGAWRRDPLDDRPARAAVHGCGQGAGAGRGHGGARAGSARRREGRARRRGCTTSWRRRRLVRRALDGLDGRRGARLLERRGVDDGYCDAPSASASRPIRATQAARRRSRHSATTKLVEAGLLIPVEDKEPYDRFRGRLMIPIRDPRGRAIAFGGRIIGDGEPKYLNSPDTPLFDKGRTLYNLDRAAAGRAQGGADDRRRRLYGRDRARPGGHRARPSPRSAPR